MPGQVIHNATRRLVLQGADGVVFVADSQRSETKANSESFLNLRQNLKDNGIDPARLPLVIQFNKRDLPDIRTDEEIDALAERGREEVFKSIAIRGIGVLETLMGLLEATWMRLEEEHALEDKFGLQPDALLGRDARPPRHRRYRAKDSAVSEARSRAELSLADVSQLEDILDKDALADVCRSFFDLFSLPLRVFSRNGALLADVHETRQVCAYVNGFPEGRLACSRLVGQVKGIDPEDGTVIHPCFTGAVYRVVPITYQGRRLGRFVIGPYLPAERKEVPRTLLEVAQGVEAEQARTALQEMPRVREETAERIAEHLTRVLDLILFGGHRAFLTSEMHIASVRESYRELMEKQDALQAAFDRLKELDQLKSNFLATVSHELRTPLTSIIGYSDMLASGLAGELNEEQQEFVDTIRTKGDHLLALISSLLDLGKLEQDQLKLQREPLDPRALLDDVVRTLAPTAAKKQVELRVEGPETMAPFDADPLRLRQVLSNLAENAVKFSPSGGAVVLGVTEEAEAPPEGLEDGDVGLVLMAAPRRVLRFSVSDNGRGIPSGEHDRIFDAFYQVDGGSTREHGGTGLGLSIVKRLVDAHGGRVEVESEVGQGATFVIHLPEPDSQG